MPKRYKYVIKQGKRMDDFTGTFKTLDEAEKWKDKWGEYHEKKGYKLILQEFKSANG